MTLLYACPVLLITVKRERERLVLFIRLIFYIIFIYTRAHDCGLNHRGTSVRYFQLRYYFTTPFYPAPSIRAFST